MLVQVVALQELPARQAGPVATSLTLDEHLAAIAENGLRLAEHAAAAGGEASVPSCPAWDAHALVAHQAMVHRWAGANVRGDDQSTVPTAEELRARFCGFDVLLGYYSEGHARLLDALRSAPSDLRAPRFLNDAPAPREFWARRQAHETTIHMVDALAASLGRLPRAVESSVETAAAVDGIDELVRGFFTRGRSKLYRGYQYSIAVVPNDAPRRWVLRVAEQLAVDTGDSAATAEIELTGSAAQLYLALWNRGDEADVAGRGDLLDDWRASQRVQWS